MHLWPETQGSLQLKQSFFLISSRLVSSSNFSLPFHSLWNGFLSRCLWGTNGLEKVLVFGTESARSRVRRMASCKVGGMYAFAHPLKGSVSPSVNSMINLGSDISVTATTTHRNFMMNASAVLVCLSQARSLKCISRSFLSKPVHEPICKLPIGGDATVTQCHQSMIPPLVCLTLQV
jgi:hypothetical protein